MSSRKLEDCSLAMLAHLVEFEEQMRGEGIPFVRACTYRSAEEQELEYAKGRTAPGRIVTWAPGGQSLHNDTSNGKPAANAADYYPLQNGRLLDNKTDYEIAIWNRMGAIAVKCGLEWGGNWPLLKRDMPHVQLNRAAYMQQHRPDLANLNSDPKN
jgi:peptidoglycan L-alanyl-D-glutamate endopeptidase CwlK